MTLVALSDSSLRRINSVAIGGEADTGRRAFRIARGAHDPQRTLNTRSVALRWRHLIQGRPLPDSAKQALIQLPRIRRRFRPAKILPFEMPGERQASNTIR